MKNIFEINSLVPKNVKYDLSSTKNKNEFIPIDYDFFFSTIKRTFPLGRLGVYKFDQMKSNKIKIRKLLLGGGLGYEKRYEILEKNYKNIFGDFVNVNNEGTKSKINNWRNLYFSLNGRKFHGHIEKMLIPDINISNENDHVKIMFYKLFISCINNKNCNLCRDMNNDCKLFVKINNHFKAINSNWKELMGYYFKMIKIIENGKDAIADFSDDKIDISCLDYSIVNLCYFLTNFAFTPSECNPPVNSAFSCFINHEHRIYKTDSGLKDPYLHYVCNYALKLMMDHEKLYEKGKIQKCCKPINTIVLHLFVFFKGFFYHRKGEYEKGIKYFQLFMKNEKNSKEYLHRSFTQDGEFGKDIYLVELFNYCYYIIFSLYYYENNYQESFKYYERSVKLNSFYLGYPMRCIYDVFMYGFLKYRIKDYLNALKYFKRFNKLDREAKESDNSLFIDSQRLISYSYYFLKQYDKCLPILQKVLRYYKNKDTKKLCRHHWKSTRIRRIQFEQKVCQNFLGLNKKCEECLIEKKKLKVCSNCKYTKYCSRECQIKNYKKHKSFCFQPKEIFHHQIGIIYSEVFRIVRSCRRNDNNS